MVTRGSGCADLLRCGGRVAVVPMADGEPRVVDGTLDAIAV